MGCETWRPVVGYEDAYEVSDQGRVRRAHPDGRSRNPDGILREFVNHGGYHIVTLGHANTRFVHHLVLEAFVGPCPAGQETRHLNGNPADNRPENLAWGTRSENTDDQVRLGTHHSARVTECPHGHPYTKENTMVEHRKNGRTVRSCRTCKREAFRRWYAKTHGGAAVIGATAILSLALAAGPVLAAGSDGSTPYTVTAQGLTLPAGSTFVDGGHVNIRYTVDGVERSAGIHFEALNNQPSGQWIGKNYLPWSALIPDDAYCIDWVQVAEFNEHYGEGGQPPICTDDDEPTPTPTETTPVPTSTPTETATPTAEPTHTATPTVTPTVTVSPEPTPSVTGTATPEPTTTSTAEPTPSYNPSAEPTPTGPATEETTEPSVAPQNPGETIGRGATTSPTPTVSAALGVAPRVPSSSPSVSSIDAPEEETAAPVRALIESGEGASSNGRSVAMVAAGVGSLALASVGAVSALWRRRGRHE